MIVQSKSLLSVFALIVSSTGLMAAYTVPMWKPAEVLKSSSFKFVPVEGASDLNETSQNKLSDNQSAGLLQDVANPSTDAGKNIRNHRVRLTPDGFVKGSVSVNSLSGEPVNIENARVLLIQNGVIKTESKTKSDGSFQLKDTGVGNFSVFVVGVEAFMAYGVEIVAPQASTSVDQAGQTEESMNVSLAEESESVIKSTAVPPRDFKVLNEIIDKYMPGIRGKSAQTSSAGNNAELLPADDTPASYEPDPAISSNPVLLNDNNELVGRVKRYHPKENQPVRLRKMQAVLISDGKKIDETQIKEDGTFVFKNVKPGPYSFAAAGIDGFSAMGMNVQSSRGSQLVSVDTPRELVFELVNFVAGGGTGGTLSSTEDTATGLGEQDKETQNNPPQNPTPPTPPVNPPAGNPNGGGNGGGTGGGAGGGGGGGVVPALLGAAGLGLGAAALADDNDEQTSP